MVDVNLNNIIKFNNLTKRVCELEKTTQALQNFINDNKGR